MPSRLRLHLLLSLLLPVLPAGLRAGPAPPQNPARTGCSRPLRVPVAAVGASVTVGKGQVGGAYPSLLRKLGEGAGCRFEFEAMPRARVEQLFERGRADLLVPASRSDARDGFGEFVPLVQSRAAAVALSAPRAPVTSLQDLLSRTGLRVVVVRGFHFGTAYKDAVTELQRQGRLVLEPDLNALARALQAGMADLALLTPAMLFTAIEGEPRLQGLRERLRVEPLDDMGWSDSGLYLSTQSLSTSERELLRRLLEQARSNGSIWKTLIEHYPPGSLEGAMRAR